MISVFGLGSQLGVISSLAMEALFEEAKKRQMLGRHDKAEELYTEFIDSCNMCNAEVNSAGGRAADVLLSQLAEAYNNRGQIKYLRVDFDEAIEDYTSAVNIDSSFATAYYNRGQIHYRLGRFQEGIDDFQEALKHQPNFPDARVALQTAEEDQQQSKSQSSSNVSTDMPSE